MGIVAGKKPVVEGKRGCATLENGRAWMDGWMGGWMGTKAAERFHLAKDKTKYVDLTANLH